MDPTIVAEVKNGYRLHLRAKLDENCVTVRDGLACKSNNAGCKPASSGPHPASTTHPRASHLNHTLYTPVCAVQSGPTPRLNVHPELCSDSLIGIHFDECAPRVVQLLTIGILFDIFRSSGVIRDVFTSEVKVDGCPTARVSGPNEVAQSVSITIIEPMASLPPFCSWNSLQKNYRVDDQPVLKHLPYFGDDADGCDLSLFEQSSDDDSDALDDIDDAVLLTVLNKYGTNSMVLDSLRLAMNVGEAKLKAQVDHLVNSSPESDNEADSFANPSPANPDELMDSFRHLFCRRCYLFDCKSHGVDQPLPLAEERGEWNRESPHTRSCGKYCWQTERATDVGQWTQLERIMFEQAWPGLGKDSCVMAQILNTKTCQQVYLYAKTVQLSSPSRRQPKAKAKGSVRVKNEYRKTLQKIDKRKEAPHEYLPCEHEGPCSEQNNCPCALNNQFCEKFCGCSHSCPKRFPGCKCRKSRCNSRQCPCYAVSRECDPDLCFSCEANTLPEDIPSHSERLCLNVCGQTKKHKHLLLGISDVSGWGCFIKEGAEKHEFIQEYVGEVISQVEAERRGKIYDRMNCSFLFDLNQETVVDATRKGNKTKFANHSDSPNCYCRVVFINGDHRIGLFAKEPIRPGDELFFNYQYTEENMPKWQRRLKNQNETGNSDWNGEQNGTKKRRKYSKRKDKGKYKARGDIRQSANGAKRDRHL